MPYFFIFSTWRWWICGRSTLEQSNLFNFILPETLGKGFQKKIPFLMKFSSYTASDRFANDIHKSKNIFQLPILF